MTHNLLVLPLLTPASFTGTQGHRASYRGGVQRASHTGSVYSASSRRMSDRGGRPALEQLALPMTSAYQVQFRSLGNISITLPQPRFSFSRRHVKPVSESGGGGMNFLLRAGSEVMRVHVHEGGE